MPSPTAEVLDYISDNNLPCKVFLDGRNGSKLYISGTNFYWKNTVDYPQYDFVQSNSAYHPSILGKGVSFSSNDRLYPVDRSLFANAKSYSTLFITQTDVSITQQLLTIGNRLSTYPNVLDYKLNTLKAVQNFAIRNVGAEKATSNISDLTTGTTVSQSIIFNHDVKLGITNFSVNSATFDRFINSNKGYLPTFDPYLFYLGNDNTAGSPFTGKLCYFLVFIPKITNAQLVDISNILLGGLGSITWNDVSIDIWNSMTEDDWNNLE
jgi:hypothetical protein